MFEIRNLKFKSILDIESLDIKSNRVTCILGESGCGKTTLLRTLNKLISYTSGDIRYNGSSLKDIDSVDHRRSVVMLSQSPGIFKGTVRDNLLMGLRFSEKPMADDASLKECLKSIRLDKELDANSDKLSGGEKQRLALGRILLMDPDVYLLDEPSSALDSGTEHLIIEELTNLSKKHNKTLIMVTHSKDIATEFADDIVTLSAGKVINARRSEDE